VAAKFAPDDILLVFSLDRLSAMARKRKKGKFITEPDFIFRGNYVECLLFIEKRARRSGNNIYDDIVIETKRHGVVKWKISDLHHALHAEQEGKK
jgi:hypothetical protein